MRAPTLRRLAAVSGVALLAGAPAGGCGSNGSRPGRAPAASPAGLAAAPGARAGPSLRWFGQACFLATTSKGTRIAMDPFGERVGYPVPAIDADILTISHEHFDHNNASAVRGDPRIFRGGDRSRGRPVPRTTVRDVTLWSVIADHDDAGGAKRGKVALFVFAFDGIRIVHLGDLGRPLRPEEKAGIGPVEVALVPVGGHFTIDAEGARAVIRDLAPKRFIVPMHYKTPRVALPIAGVEPFLEGWDAVERDVARLDLSRRPERPTVAVLRYE